MPKARYNVGPFSVRSDIPNSGSMASPTNHPSSPPFDNDKMQWNPSHYAWFVVALLVPVALLNYLDRQMLAAMKASVSAETGIVTSEQWGTVLALFKWVYAGLSPIGGLVADRFSRRHVIAISLFVWSGVTWSTGLVADYQQLLITRALMGISEAFYIPAALALITEYHPRATRSRAVSMHQMGIYFGVILGGFSGYVADSPDYGWRWLFGLCGVIGIVYASRTVVERGILAIGFVLYPAGDPRLDHSRLDARDSEKRVWD
jgi:MFS family permease